MSIIIENNRDLTNYLLSTLGKIQKLGEDFQLFILPVNHAKTLTEIEPALKALPGYREPIIYGGADSHAGSFSLSSQRTIDDVIAEIKSGSVSATILLALADSLAKDVDDETTVSVQCPFGAVNVCRKTFAQKLGLSDNEEANRSQKLYYISLLARQRGRYYVVFSRRDQLDDKKEKSQVHKPQALSRHFPALIERGLNNFETTASINIDGVENGRALLLHPEFQDLIDHLRPGHGYFAETRDGILELQI